MFGILRFVLAILVVIDHVTFSKNSFHFGVSAVGGFFLISGFVMFKLIEKHYFKFGKLTFMFYLDRLLRMYPQFLLYLLLTLIAWYMMPFPELAQFFWGPGSLKLFLANVSLIPVNYYFFFPSLERFCLLPQTWSLALEEQFYWIVPIFAIKQMTGFVFGIISFAIFVFALNQMYFSELFLYRMLPGVLFLFCIGLWLASLNKIKLVLISIMYLTCTYFFILAIFYNQKLPLFGSEIISTVIVGTPLIYILKRLKRHIIDDTVGNYSYGLFLSHVLVMNIITNTQYFDRSGAAYVFIVVLISILCGIISFHVIEKPIKSKRLQIRAKINI